MSFASPSRPVLALRVGVTGARELEPSALEQIGAQAKHWLERLKGEMERLAALPAVAAAYVPGSTAPLLRFTSPLARGADRLVARMALDVGWPLYAILPFPQADYERDFTEPGGLAEFRALLGEVVDGGVLELDGGRDDLEPQSYGAAGRAVVARSDLVIAVWDGKPSKRRGGTWDTIRFAIRQGVPVLWIDAAGTAPSRWLSSHRELLRPAHAPTDVEAAVRRHLERLVLPPVPWHRHAHGWFDRLVFLRAPAHVAPERDYWSEKPLPQSWLAQSHTRFMALFAAGWRHHLPQAAAAPAPAASAGPTILSSYWHDRLAAPDQLSVDYARRYRSTYVWVFLLAALSLLFGATALVPAVIHAAAPAGHGAGEGHGHAASVFSAHNVASLFAVLEALCLGVILFLVVKVKRKAWHEKSIDYRLLAELYRKQGMLAPLGWTLPVTDVETVAGAKKRRQAERSSWVAWQFAADVRAAPFPGGNIDVAREKGEVAATVAGQVRYHAGRACQSELAARRLEGFGAAAFFLVLAGVAAKLGFGVLGANALAVFAGWSAVVLPAFSAAFVGIRAYAELELLAAQSQHMAIELAAAEAHIASIDPAAALASADLGSETLAVTEVMLQDLEGWARLFRLKVAEVG